MTRSRGVRPVERKPPKDQSSRGNSTQPHFSCLPPDFCPNRRTILLACRNIRFGCLRGQFVRSCSGLLSYETASRYTDRSRRLGVRLNLTDAGPFFSVKENCPLN